MIVEEVRLWKLTRRHVRERLEQGLIKGAILPTGSTEQHNEHLAMEHDTASAAYVAHQGGLAALSASGGSHASVHRHIRALDGVSRHLEPAARDLLYRGLRRVRVAQAARD